MRIRGVKAKELALACATLVLVACGGGSGSGSSGTNTASATGITASTITIGSTQPLTGPAAPGYSEIAAASNAYFQYVNDHGGVYGRKIKYEYRDDGYNPTNTASVTRQLVLQDKVFAIFNALGTPTHLAVIDYLNTEKVPDVFVASGCNCWNNPSKYPYTFGWQPDYTIEGKILGQYINQNLAGKKVGYFYQDDEFGADGLKGLDQKVTSSMVVSRQAYVPTNTNVGPQIAALQASGAQVVASFSIPAFTALALLTAAKLGYHPIWVVSNVGSDAPTLSALLQSFSKGAAGASLLGGLVTDAYLPLANEGSNPWIALFSKVRQQYASNLPFDGNVIYGMAVAYTFVQELKAAGRNPTRSDFLKTVENNKIAGGPGLAPFAFSAGSHGGYAGVQIATLDQTGTGSRSGPVYTSSDNGGITPSSGTNAAPPSSGVP